MIGLAPDSSVEQQSNSLEVAVHPLVLVNVGDHILREKSANNGPSMVVGVLLGSINGRLLEIHNTFELATSFSLAENASSSTQETERHLTLDLDFFQLRLSQFQEVFPDVDFAGWYRVHINGVVDSELINMRPTSYDLDILSSLGHISVNPYVMLVDTRKANIQEDPDGDLFGKQLPVRIFEKVAHGCTRETLKRAEQCFRQVDFVLTSLEAERIAVDHVSKKGVAASIVAQSLAQSSDVPRTKKDDDEAGDVMTPFESPQSPAANEVIPYGILTSTDSSTDYILHLNSLSRAVEVMVSRLKVVRLYLESVKAGRVEKDNLILREISAICNSRTRQLKETEDSGNDVQFAREFCGEYESGLISVYLSALTRFTSDLHDTSEMFTASFDRRSFRERFEGYITRNRL